MSTQPYTTLRQIIENRDFAGRRITEGGYDLDAHEIENILYGRHDGCWKQHEGFAENEGATVVDIATGDNIDDGTGLQIYCLKGEPIGVLYQSYSKGDRDIAFLSVEARDTFAAAWERHRVPPNKEDSLILPGLLDMPVAPAGTDPFKVEGTGAHDVHLSAAGIAQWLKLIEPQGGIASVDDPAVVDHAIHVVEKDIAQTQREIDKVNTAPAENVARHQKYFDDYLARSLKRIEILDRDFLDPLKKRSEELKATKSA